MGGEILSINKRNLLYTTSRDLKNWCKAKINKEILN